MDYNTTKGGVNTVSIHKYKDFDFKKTKRWPMIIFFRYLNIAGICDTPREFTK